MTSIVANGWIKNSFLLFGTKLAKNQQENYEPKFFDNILVLSILGTKNARKSI